MHTSLGWSTVLPAVALVLSGCGGDPDPVAPDPAASGPRIVATTAVLGDVVANVLGGTGALHVLIPAGVDPHAYEPSPGAAARLREADLVVANGLQLEVGLLDVLEAAESDGVPVMRVAEDLDPIAFTGGHGQEDTGEDHAEDDHAQDDHAQDDHSQDDHTGEDDTEDRTDHDHGGALDPHFWFDPVRTADAVTAIGERVAEVAPERAEEVRRNAEDYRKQVLALHERVAGILDGIPPGRRQLVTNHDSLGYLADRYDLEVVGTVVPGGTTLGEASSRELAELVETVRETGAPAIFIDTSAPDRIARALSREVGGDIEVVDLHTDSLGPEGSGAETYLGLIETDARRIADALTG